MSHFASIPTTCLLARIITTYWTTTLNREFAVSNSPAQSLIENAGDEIADALIEIADELTQLRERAFPPKPPIVLSGEADWPWAPGTQVQGFLGSRWNRRDGTVYGTPTPAPTVIHLRKRDG